MRTLPNGYSIRPANSEDIARMIAADIAASELFRSTGLIYNMPAVPDGVSSEILREAIKNEKLLAADFEGAAVGFALMSICDETDYYLDQLSVDPAHGRKGIGRELVLACFALAESLNHQEVYLYLRLRFHHNIRVFVFSCL